VSTHVLDQFITDARWKIRRRDAKPRQVSIDQLIGMFGAHDFVPS
jgi:hypothetical protein